MEDVSMNDLIETKRKQAELIKVLVEALIFYKRGFYCVPAFKHIGGLNWEPTDSLLEDCGNHATEAIKRAAEMGF